MDRSPRPSTTELVRSPALPDEQDLATTLRVPTNQVTRLLESYQPPPLVVEAGPFAQYAYAEFFSAEIGSDGTRRKYRYNVDRFLGWLERQGIGWRDVSAPVVSEYIREHLHKANGQPLSDPAKKQHLSALRSFYDVQERRHGILFNPAAAVRGPTHNPKKGKTRPFPPGQVTQLLASIDTSHVVGLRDRAILATLYYTACRDGAAARLRIRDWMSDGERSWLNFGEKGGRPHTVKAHKQLQRYMEEYLAAAGITGDPGDWPLFRSARGKTKKLSPYVPPDPKMNRKAHGGITGLEINAMLKRRLRDARLPASTYTGHSFRATTATSLCKKGIPLEKVQSLLGHIDPRTTKLYDHSSDNGAEEIVDEISDE